MSKFILLIIYYLFFRQRKKDIKKFMNIFEISHRESDSSLKEIEDYSSDS